MKDNIKLDHRYINMEVKYRSITGRINIKFWIVVTWVGERRRSMREGGKGMRSVCFVIIFKAR
jgi:hypothetical protein